MHSAVQRVVTALLLVAAVVGLEFSFEYIIPDAAWRQLALLAMVNVIAALSLNIINGMAGQFSIGHAGFLGIGAYTGAIVAGNLHPMLGGGDPLFEWSFVVMPAVMLSAGVVAGAFGLLVGLPSLRLRGDYLAIVTLGFAEIFRLVIGTAETGGAAEGTINQALASLGGQQGYAGPDGTGVPQYAGPFWIFGAVIVATVLAWRLKFSGWGRTLRALRADEIASAAVGVDPTRYKVTSFVFSAAGAGIAGGLMASIRDGNPTVQPEQFNFATSFDAITMVILGGSGSVSGAVLGGVLVTFTVKMIEQLQGLDSVQALKSVYPSLDLNALRMVVYASVLLGLMILRPEGLLGEREIFRRKATMKNGAAPPEPVPVRTKAEVASDEPDGASPETAIEHEEQPLEKDRS
ncbi:branched-chain amino acid ABC transporter permease [Chondromyces crocatus]|uniref:ABC transporter permease n=1 Tax=Chondromyces crocatus TaxID=52 RepID=A0A0K1E5Q0_CHOCO|nr:ABC transporter permease [Chondromyces crocatus]